MSAGREVYAVAVKSGLRVRQRCVWRYPNAAIEGFPGVC